MTPEAQESARATFEQLLAAMVEHPTDLTVTLVPSQRKPTLVIGCHRVDFGAILGKRGQMLTHLKYFANILGARHDTRLDIILDEAKCTGETGTRRRFEPDPAWDPEPFEKLVNLFCADILGNCIVTVEPASSTTSKVTVTMPDGTGDGSTLETALDAVLNCVGIIQGRRFIVEVV